MLKMEKNPTFPHMCSLGRGTTLFTLPQLDEDATTPTLPEAVSSPPPACEQCSVCDSCIPVRQTACQPFDSKAEAATAPGGGRGCGAGMSNCGNISPPLGAVQTRHPCCRGCGSQLTGTGRGASSYLQKSM